MSYTSKDGTTVPFRLMDRIKPRVARLAIALGFPEHIIANLKTDPDPVFSLLTEWLKGGNQEHDSRPLTWSTLLTALGEAGLLEEVRILEKYFVAAPSVTERGGMSICCGDAVHCDNLLTKAFVGFLLTVYKQKQFENRIYHSSIIIEIMYLIVSVYH